MLKNLVVFFSMCNTTRSSTNRFTNSNNCPCVWRKKY